MDGPGEGALRKPAWLCTKSAKLQLPRDETDIVIRWRRDEQENELADILVDDLVIGRLGAGQKPGWARAAMKDGPLAKVLEKAGEIGTGGKDTPESHDHETCHGSTTGKR